MNTRSVALLLILLGVMSLRAADSGMPGSLDPLCFLAGLSISGQESGSIYPPQCESFYKDGGERRAAEMFLAAAQTGEKTWGNTPCADPYPIKYHYQESGHRYIVENPGLAEDLRRFYDRASSVNKANITQLFWSPTNQNQWLSFVAGVYARCFHDGVFEGRPSAAMRDVVIILLAEGCEVSDLTINKEGVPATMQFRIKPSERVAKVFAEVDKWQPIQSDWKAAE